MKYPHSHPYGGAHILRFTTSTHDEHGQLTKSPEKVRRLNERLAAKVESHLDEISMVKADMQPVRDIDHQLWGDYPGRGGSCSYCPGEGQVRLLVDDILPMAGAGKGDQGCDAGVRKVIVPELNLGQYSWKWSGWHRWS